MKRCPIPRVCTPEPLNWGRPVYQHPGGTFRWREPFSDEEAPMDANSGEPWSEADISDLKNEIAHGRTMAETASFLCRDEDEVREKMRELGLVEQPRVL
jgi:hypothetical protein